MEGLKPGEKYAFKFYLTSPLKDNGSDKYVIKSPYLPYIKDESPLPELAYTGKRINEAPLNDTEDFADEESKRNYLADPDQYMTDKHIYRRMSYAPHRGISLIGLADPEYSTYDLASLDQIANDFRDRHFTGKQVRELDTEDEVRSDGIYPAQNGIGDLAPFYGLSKWPLDKLSTIYDKDKIYDSYSNAVLKGIKYALSGKYSKYGYGIPDDDPINTEISNAIDKFGINFNKALASKNKKEVIDFTDLLNDIKSAYSRYYDRNYKLFEGGKHDITANDLDLLIDLKTMLSSENNDNLIDLIGKNFDYSNYTMLPNHNEYVVKNTDINGLPFRSYIGLLRALQRTAKSIGEDGDDAGLYNDLWLAAVPESALYKRKDLLNRKLRGQRDFPEELVAKRIRLLDDLYKPHDQYKRGWLGSSSPLGSELINTDLGHMSNEDARKWVMDHFEIDPEYIISDEACKVIYDDMSNDFEKHNRQGNIVNGLSGGDNKWR